MSLKKRVTRLKEIKIHVITLHPLIITILQSTCNAHLINKDHNRKLWVPRICHISNSQAREPKIYPVGVFPSVPSSNNFVSLVTCATLRRPDAS